jgi:acetyltransferase
MVALGQRVAHDRLIRICFNDFDREMALVVESKGEILGVGRLSRIPGKDEAEFSVLISDKFQRRGLGAELMRRLVDVGRQEKLKRISARILSENAGMQSICKQLGFRLKRDTEENVILAEIAL